MPFVQRVIEPKFLSRTSLWDEDGKPLVVDEELEAVTNNTLSNALRQLASLVLVADDIFAELGGQLKEINKRSEGLKAKIEAVEGKVSAYDPKKVTVPESDICTFAVLKQHYAAKCDPDTNLFTAETRPRALQALYEAATKTPVHLMRQLDRWRRDGHRSSRFFLCTPVLGNKRRKIRNKVDIDIETRMPASVRELRRWTSSEALGDITVTPDCPNRIAPNVTLTDGEVTDATAVSDDEGIDHKLPSPEEQLQVVALKFPAEIVAVDVSGRSFDRMSIQRRSLLQTDISANLEDSNNLKRRTRTRRPRSRRRNTLAGTDHKEIRDALIAGEEPCSSANNHETESTTIGAVSRSKSSDLLRSSNKKDSPDKKSHFNTLKQWGKNRYDRLMNKNSESKADKKDDIDDFNIYETVTMKRRRNVDKDRRSHERNPSISSSDKSSVNLPISSPLSSVMNIAVKLRESSAQRRQRRSGGNKDEPPHSSSGNWSASSESGRASIGSEFTTTTQPKSSTSTATSNNSLNQQAPNSANSKRRFNVNTSTSSSITSEGTLTPDIIHDLHEDGETSSVYSCDTEGYYTSFHMDSGLKTLKEEELPCTPLHSTSAFSSSSNNTILTAENEYELFGKGSTSTTTSSAGTVCTTLRASESNKSLNGCPAVPERKSSLSKFTNKDNSPEERDESSDKTGTVKRSPATNKASVIAMVHKQVNGDVSPDSGHNTSSSPIESVNSPNGVRSGSEFEFSESSDMEGPERIERIRVKTTINSSRIPSMCVITPPHSDDESVNSYSLNNFNKRNLTDKGSKNADRNKLDLNLKTGENEVNLLKSSDSDKENYNIQSRIITTNVNGTSKMQLINVNPQSGYATVETVDGENLDVNKNSKILRAPSPSGGSVTVNETPLGKSPPSQPIIKATLLPLNNMFGRIKTNLANLTRRDSKSPNRNTQVVSDELSDAGDYVTLADVKNNNEKVLPIPKEELVYANDVVGKSAKGPGEKIRDTEYVCLDELPCNEEQQNLGSTNDSLERTKRQGARVTLDAEGKVVYSSDSLRRRKGAHTTFEPGPFVKATSSPTQSPLPVHRIPKSVRPASNKDQNRPLSPQLGKLVIRAVAGMTSPTSEIVRMPPSTIVAPSVRPMSPKATGARGAYVHIQDTGRPPSPTQEQDRVPSPSNYPGNPSFGNQASQPHTKEMYYKGTILDGNVDKRRYPENQYYFQQGGSMYQTLPSKRTQYFQADINPERSVTPDITRGLERNSKSIYNPYPRDHEQNLLHQKLGIPVKIPDVSNFMLPSQKVPLSSRTTDFYGEKPNSYFAHISPHKSVDTSHDSIRISPIDPRNSGSFHSSTPSSKTQDLKAAVNLESRLLSPKKSTMSNEELYAVIHKSKKKMNIHTEENRESPVSCDVKTPPPVKSPETGYIGDKSRSRLSWSPSKGEYVDFNADIDKLSPPNESRSRQSWACSDRKGACQTSRLDFKKLLLQKSNVLANNNTKKLSAVEQLKMSKQQLQKPSQQPFNILELSGSPRSLVNRKFTNNGQSSPRNNTPEKPKPAPKLMSPRSQWRFANPRTDVLSSTILEDCREDESPSNSMEKKKSSPAHPRNKTEVPTSPSAEPKTYSSISQRLQAQRARFFNSEKSDVQSSQKLLKNSQLQSQQTKDKCSVPPTLETAF
ncbi:unnamed protein product [Tenebrio molitor]|nr:unnamed protein product [Tenebrio molitor]